MASVEPYRWRVGRACRPLVCPEPHDSACKVCRPSHGDKCTCKVLAWRCRWRTPEGSSRSENFTTARDANAKKADVESSRNRGSYVDAARGRVRFEDYAREWAEAQDWKPKTRESWSPVYKRLCWVLGGRRMGDIDRLALEQARGKLAGKYARSTAEHTMTYAKAVCRFAYDNGDIGRDPTSNVKAAPKRRADDTTGKVTPEMVPTREEALHILASMVDGWRAAWALGLAGLRVNEVLGMRCDRIDLAKRTVTVDAQAVALIRQGVMLTTPKEEKCRTIVVPQLVAMELRRHMREGHGGTWVDAEGVAHEMLFLRPTDGTVWRREQFYEVAWWPSLTAAGFGPVQAEGVKTPVAAGRFKFHAGRHHCASTLLSQGAPLTAVAGYLGDVIETVTKTYAHWLRDDRDIPAQVLDRMYSAGNEHAAPAQAVTRS